MFLAYLRGIETKSDISYLLLFPVFSVPTRNWNRKRNSTVQVQYMVFSVPTRNWNKAEYIQANQMIATFLAYLRGIETGMFLCRWKMVCQVFSVPTRNWNFSPVFTVAIRLSVFSVPTRNWNQNMVTLVRYLESGFLAYLRGIEILLGLCHECNLWRF